MPDGVVLLADRYRPRGAGPLPVVLMRTPYGKHRIDAKAFASVLVSSRATMGPGSRRRGPCGHGVPGSRSFMVRNIPPQ
ncbi:CocE/NonD family hydrolase [Nonomuraea sp. NPDC050680]|uniref:CocE/NonD family hydrolase n=1 Tax=Nonomuraea sp. NPDC050680 TaxID=3154630 RepID=UPI00340CB265